MTQNINNYVIIVVTNSLVKLYLNKNYILIEKLNNISFTIQNDLTIFIPDMNIRKK